MGPEQLSVYKQADHTLVQFPQNVLNRNMKMMNLPVQGDSVSAGWKCWAFLLGAFAIIGGLFYCMMVPGTPKISARALNILADEDYAPSNEEGNASWLPSLKRTAVIGGLAGLAYGAY